MDSVGVSPGDRAVRESERESSPGPAGEGRGQKSESLVTECRLPLSLGPESSSERMGKKLRWILRCRAVTRAYRRHDQGIRAGRRGPGPEDVGLRARAISVSWGKGESCRSHEERRSGGTDTPRDVLPTHGTKNHAAALKGTGPKPLLGRRRNALGARGGGLGQELAEQPPPLGRPRAGAGPEGVRTLCWLQPPMGTQPRT